MWAVSLLAKSTSPRKITLFNLKEKPKTTDSDIWWHLKMSHLKVNHFVVQKEDWQPYDLSLFQLELIKVLFSDMKQRYHEMPLSSPKPEMPVKPQLTWTSSVCWGNEWTEHPVASQGLLHSLWSLHKIYHVNVTYTYGYLNERCYHLWRNKCGYKWTLALWYMMSLQAGEIYQVSSINIIIIIILSTLFNLSQAFNSVFSQLILMTLL